MLLVKMSIVGTNRIQYNKINGKLQTHKSVFQTTIILVMNNNIDKELIVFLHLNAFLYFLILNKQYWVLVKVQSVDFKNIRIA